MSEFKSNGARRPMHTVRRADRPQPGRQGAAGLGPRPGMATGGSLRLSGLARAEGPKVTLPEIPSLARDIALTLEDGLFMHAVRMAAEAMLEGADAAGHVVQDFTPLTIEEEGALMRAFGGDLGPAVVCSGVADEGALVRAFGLPRRADA